MLIMLGTGKSSILRRYLDNKFYDSYDVTIGVDFGSKTININDNTIKALIWDTVQESFLLLGWIRNISFIN